MSPTPPSCVSVAASKVTRRRPCRRASVSSCKGADFVTGGEDHEQRRFGDSLSKHEHYARTDEFLTTVRGSYVS
jgi:hypothetical protein